MSGEIGSGRPSPPHRVVEAAVRSGEVVGAVVLVSRGGRITRTIVAGHADREAGRPMDLACRFRIASMSKAIVSVAALSLSDRRALDLDDPVSRFLPGFAPALADGSRPPVTTRHLLTHTAGLGYTFTEPVDGPYRRRGISDGLDAAPLTLAGNTALVAAETLRHPPGSAWAYSIATDVLGAVLEAVTGQTLPALVRDLVTGPLGLQATGFQAEPGSSVATPYVVGETGVARMSDPCILPFFGSEIRYSPGRLFDATAWPSAGTGMVSTAADYLCFLEMIRGGGAPVLAPATAEAFTTNAIGSLATAAGAGIGWGLGVSVVLDPVAAGLPGNPGSWGWGGVYGSHFFVDPRAALSVVCLTNTALTGMTGPFVRALRAAIYQDF